MRLTALLEARYASRRRTAETSRTLSAGKFAKMGKEKAHGRIAMCIANEAARTYVLLDGPRGSPMRLARVIVVAVGCDIAPFPQHATERTRIERRVNTHIFDRQSMSIESRPDRVPNAGSRTHRRRRAAACRQCYHLGRQIIIYKTN